MRLLEKEVNKGQDPVKKLCTLTVLIYSYMTMTKKESIPATHPPWFFWLCAWLQLTASARIENKGYFSAMQVCNSQLRKPKVIFKVLMPSLGLVWTLETFHQHFQAIHFGASLQTVQTVSTYPVSSVQLMTEVVSVFDDQSHFKTW